MKSKNVFAAFVMTIAISATACAKDKKTDPVKEKEVKTEVTTEVTSKDQPNIVEVAAGNSDFSTLVTAVKAAGLVETLSSEGPFTVFAPTNDAFGKLPEGTIPSLLKPESKDALTGILTYHVISGKFMAADVVKAISDNNGSFTIPTVQGGSLTATLKDGSVILTDTKGNKSKVVITDVGASNGVIHAIDTVVMP
ncbi:MAG: fasciclin domain-containing protein [Flavobacteriaceae bacterium]|nr:fasciclin domain-containing protein [Flavobacteriaceae bacterium]